MDRPRIVAASESWCTFGSMVVVTPKHDVKSATTMGSQGKTVLFPQGGREGDMRVWGLRFCRCADPAHGTIQFAYAGYPSGGDQCKESLKRRRYCASTKQDSADMNAAGRFSRSERTSRLKRTPTLLTNMPCLGDPRHRSRRCCTVGRGASQDERATCSTPFKFICLPPARCHATFVFFLPAAMLRRHLEQLRPRSCGDGAAGGPSFCSNVT